MIRTAILVVVLTVFVGALGWSLYRGYRSGFSVPDDTRQLIVGLTPSWSSSFAEIRRFKRDGDGKPWYQVGPASVMTFAEGGLALKRGGLWPREGWLPRWLPDVAWEKAGDDKIPAGVYSDGWTCEGPGALFILLPATEYHQLWIGAFRFSNPGLPTIQ